MPRPHSTRSSFGDGPFRVQDALVGLLVLASTSLRTDGQQGWTLVLPQAGVQFLVLLSAVAAAAARTFPVPALVVASVLDALPHWVPVAGAGYHLSFMICLYMVVSRCSRRTWTAAVVIVFVVQVGLMAWRLDWMWGHLFVMVTAMSVIVSTALGFATRSRRATVLALEARAEEAERSRHSEARKLLAEDRLRLARDLHDSVAHQIAVMNLNAAVASSALPDRPEDATKALVTVRKAGRSVIASIGDLLNGLRDDDWDGREERYDVDELGALVDQFRTLMPALNLKLGPQVATSRSIDATPYLVIQEGLTNAYKHGDHDAPVTVELDRGASAYSLRVVNTTRHPACEFIEGFGLQGMRERVAAVDGQIHVSCTERTFTVSAEVPERAGTR